MRVENFSITGWDEAYANALFTIGKKPKREFATDEWCRKLVKSGHSPLYCVIVRFDLIDVPFYVMGHLVRHHVGFVPFVRTSRADRTGVPREERKQTDPVSMRVYCNMAAFVNMVQHRLCTGADPTTRAVTKLLVDAALSRCSFLEEFLKPLCQIRKDCPAFEPCGEE